MNRNVAEFTIGCRVII